MSQERLPPPQPDPCLIQSRKAKFPGGGDAHRGAGLERGGARKSALRCRGLPTGAVRALWLSAAARARLPAAAAAGGGAADAAAGRSIHLQQRGVPGDVARAAGVPGSAPVVGLAEGIDCNARRSATSERRCRVRGRDAAGGAEREVRAVPARTRRRWRSRLSASGRQLVNPGSAHHRPLPRAVRARQLLSNRAEPPALVASRRTPPFCLLTARPSRVVLAHAPGALAGIRRAPFHDAERPSSFRFLRSHLGTSPADQFGTVHCERAR